MERNITSTYISAQNTRNRRSINGRRDALARRGEIDCQPREAVVNPTDAAIIEEAILVNHAQIRADRTLKDYKRNIRHFAAYIASACGVTLGTAKRRHVLAYMRHLETHGGNNPHEMRKGCSWCVANGYPDGREGKGWSPQRRKANLSAIRFVYRHMIEEEMLEGGDPSAHLAAPPCPHKRLYTPSRDEVRAFLDAPGAPRDRLLAYWMYYAPSRRETFRQARWSDIEGLDTDQAFWWIPKAKNYKPDGFMIHPVLRRELRRYKAWQQEQAALSPRIANALSDEDTAFILLSSTGKQLHQSTLTKMVKWRAVRAKVGLVRSDDVDAVDGFNSKLTPHSLRRHGPIMPSTIPTSRLPWSWYPARWATPAHRPPLITTPAPSATEYTLR